MQIEEWLLFTEYNENEFNSVSNLACPHSHYLRSVFVIKFDIAEQCLKLIATRHLKIKLNKIYSLVGVINEIKSKLNAKKKKGEIDYEIVDRFARIIKILEGDNNQDGLRVRRNTITHGKLIADSPPTVLNVSDSSKSYSTPFISFVRGVLKFESKIKTKTIIVPFDKDTMKDLNNKLDDVLKEIHKINELLELSGGSQTTLEIICENTIISDNPDIHFGNGSRTAKISTKIDKSTILALLGMPSTQQFECPVCEKITSTRESAKNCCDSKTKPRQVKTEFCNTCDSNFAEDKLCEHLEFVKKAWGN